MIVIALGRIFTVVVSILSLKMATHILSTADYGRWILFNTITSFFVLYLISPVGHFLNRHTHEWIKSESLVQNLNNFNWYLIAISILSALFMLVDFFAFRLLSSNLTLFTIAILPLGILFVTLNQTYIPIFNLIEKRWTFILLTNLTGLLSILLSYLATQTFFPNAEGWFLGMILGNLLLGIFAYKKIRKLYGNELTSVFSKPQLGNYSSILKFSLPLALVTGCGWLQSQGYRFIIDRNLGLESLAFFATGYSVSSGILASVDSILNTYFLPSFYKNLNLDSGSQAWPNFLEKMLFPLISTSLMLGFFSDFFVKLFLAEKYDHVFTYVMWGAACETVRIINNLFQLLGHANKKTKHLIFPSVLGPTITIVSLVYFISQYQISAIGPSLLIGLLSTLLSYAIFYREKLMQVKPKKLLHTAFLLTILVVLFNVAHHFIANIYVSFIVGFSVYCVLNLYFLRDHLKFNMNRSG